MAKQRSTQQDDQHDQHTTRQSVGQRLVARAQAMAMRAAVLGAITTLLTLVIWAIGGLDGSQRWIYEQQVLHANWSAPAADARIVHVDIDDVSIAEVGRWPWDRTKIAHAIDAMAACSVDVIVLDILFEQEQKPIWQQQSSGDFVQVDHDAQLVAAMTRAKEAGTNVLLGLQYAEQNGEGTAKPLVGVIKEAATSVGVVSYDEKRSGGRVHWLAPAWGDANAEQVPSLGVAAAQLADDQAAGLRTLNMNQPMRVPWVPPTERTAGEPAWFDVHERLPIHTLVTLGEDAARVSEVQAGARDVFAQLLGVQADGLTSNTVDAFISDSYGWMLEDGYTLADLERDTKAMAEASPDNAQLQSDAQLITLARVWQKQQQALERIETRRAELGALLEGSVVFVGFAATGAAVDVAASPLGELTPGVVAHAAVANGLLTGHLYTDVPLWVVLTLCMTLGLASAFMSTAISPQRSWLAACGLLVVLVGGSAVLFDTLGLVLAVAPPAASIASAFVVCTADRAIQFRKEKRAIRAQFAARVSPQLVDILVDNPSLMNMEGEKRTVTTIFTDFAGFTAVSEGMSDQEVVAVINLYLRQITDALMDEGAYINKFLGDGVMAFWGAPTKEEDDAARGLRAAVNLFDVMQRVNAHQAKGGQVPLGMRIGMSTGEVIVGDCGAPPRLNDYTVIGDAVNLAARLESASKQFGVDMLVTKRTLDEAGEELTSTIFYRPLGRIRVVGQQQGQEICEIVGWRTGKPEHKEREAELDAWITRTKEAVTLFEQGEYAKSQDIWSELVLAPRGSAGAIMYAERCAELLESGLVDPALPLRSK